MSRPPLESFQIGWICALTVEAAAGREILDENFGVLEEQDASDPSTYTLGRIGKHHIVIACLPAGQYGPCAATTVVYNMVRTFSKSLRFGLRLGLEEESRPLTMIYGLGMLWPAAQWAPVEGCFNMT